MKSIGIDIGGTNTKFGLVDAQGCILNKAKIPTRSLIQNGDYLSGFKAALENYFEQYPKVKKVGIGIPGLLNKARTHTLEIQNIPVLNGVAFLEGLSNHFPTKNFRIENDANVAAWGEYCFGLDKLKKDFILITLGTGVGSAVVMDGQIFQGARGNAMEIGHTLIDHQHTLEDCIGKAAMVSKALKILAKSPDQTQLDLKTLDFKILLKAFNSEHEPLVRELFYEAAVLIGQSLVNFIRLFDITTVIIGGGWSKIFNMLKKNIEKTCYQHLTTYYKKDLVLKRATLKNEAGIIGAAALHL